MAESLDKNTIVSEKLQGLGLPILEPFQKGNVTFIKWGDCEVMVSDWQPYVTCLDSYSTPYCDGLERIWNTIIERDSLQKIRSLRLITVSTQDDERVEKVCVYKLEGDYITGLILLKEEIRAVSPPIIGVTKEGDWIFCLDLGALRSGSKVNLPFAVAVIGRKVELELAEVKRVFSKLITEV